MKKSLLGAMFIFTLIFPLNNISAASTCSYAEQAELNEIAGNVRVSYEVVDIYDSTERNLDRAPDEPEFIDVYVRGFKISITNITDDIYVVVKNDYNEEVKTFYKKDTEDGIASFETKNKSKLINYKIEVHSNKYSCIGQIYKTLPLQTPVYNTNSTYAICDNYKDFYYCQEFVFSDSVNEVQFFPLLEKYKEEKEQKEKQEQEKNKNIVEKVKEFYEKNKVIVNVVGVIIIISGVGIVVVLGKKKRGKRK